MTRMGEVPDSWRLKAACRNHDPEMWYAGRTQPDLVRIATWICGKCPVREQCLQYAIDTREEHGIWGGKTYADRARYAPSIRKGLPRGIRHGTVPGYRHHKLLGQNPCRPCCEADERRRARMVCGTRSGYISHRSAGEEPCAACRSANSERSRRNRRARSGLDNAPLRDNGASN